MRRSEFEEREYEGYLNRELLAVSGNFWEPGQVIEHYLGFDLGLEILDRHLFRRLGGRSRLFRGVVPYQSYRVWPQPANAAGIRGRLPRFRLNCFVQSKRSWYGNRVPKHLAELGIEKPYYKFEIEEDQQATVGAVATRLRQRAMFVYAAPVYHTSQELFRHATLGTTVESSTFPDVLALNGFHAWYYSSPGGTGVRNRRTEYLEAPGLYEHLEIFRGRFADVANIGSASQELAVLAAAIQEVIVETPVITSTARAAILAGEWRAIDRYVTETDLPHALGNFLRVAAFADVYYLTWFAVVETTT